MLTAPGTKALSRAVHPQADGLRDATCQGPGQPGHTRAKPSPESTPGGGQGGTNQLSLSLEGDRLGARFGAVPRTPSKREGTGLGVPGPQEAGAPLCWASGAGSGAGRGCGTPGSDDGGNRPAAAGGAGRVQPSRTHPGLRAPLGPRETETGPPSKLKATCPKAGWKESRSARGRREPLASALGQACPQDVLLPAS